MAEYVAIGSLILGAVGGGVSYYQGQKAASAQANIGRYNFMLQQQAAMNQAQTAKMQQQAAIQQANMQMAMQNQQAHIAQQAASSQAAMMDHAARVQQAQAALNNQMQMQAAQARLNNATAMAANAETQTAVDRTNAAKQRDEYRRMQAIQRAKIAGSGVVESGSPLELLAETAGSMQQALNEGHYQSDLQRSKSLGEAALENFGGQLDQAQAGLNLFASNQEFGLNTWAADLTRQKGAAEASFLRASGAIDAAAAQSAARMGFRQSNLERMVGMAGARNALAGTLADASGQRMAATGSLISSAAGLGNQWTSWKNQGSYTLS